MMTVWACALLSLLSIFAYSGISNAVSGSGQPLTKMPASPSIAATSRSLNTPVGVIALDVSSPRQAPDSTGNDDNLAADLSAYVFLNQTWSDRIHAPATAGPSVCEE